MSETVQELDDIIDHEETEELLDHAEENLTGVLLATIAFCKERGVPFSDWVSFLGERLAPTWDEAQGLGAREVARLAALNMVAAGGDVQALTGDDARAELLFSWPDAEDLEFFGLTREDVDPLREIYAPIATHLGLRCEARRTGDQTTLVFAR